MSTEYLIHDGIKTLTVFGTGACQCLDASNNDEVITLFTLRFCQLSGSVSLSLCLLYSVFQNLVP